MNYCEIIRGLNLAWLKDKRIRGYLNEMLKAQKGLEKIVCVKPPFLIKNKALTGPASSVGGNTLILSREPFKYKLKKLFSPDFGES